MTWPEYTLSRWELTPEDVPLLHANETLRAAFPLADDPYDVWLDPERPEAPDSSALYLDLEPRLQDDPELRAHFWFGGRSSGRRRHAPPTLMALTDEAYDILNPALAQRGRPELCVARDDALMTALVRMC